MTTWPRHWPALMVLLLALAAALPLLAPTASRADGTARHVEWPTQWDGRALRPLAMSEVEQRFAARFPGAIARFSDGERVIVLRRVEQPTRMLHPAADCFRGLGYRIERAGLERDAQQRLWRCFDAVSADLARHHRQGADYRRHAERLPGVAVGIHDALERGDRGAGNI